MVSQYITKWWIIGCPLGRETPIYKEKKKIAIYKAFQLSATTGDNTKVYLMFILCLLSIRLNKAWYKEKK